MRKIGLECDPREVETWLKRDPIAGLRARLLAAKLLTEKEDAELRAKLKSEIEAAVAEVEALPPPAHRPALHGCEGRNLAASVAMGTSRSVDSLERPWNVSRASSSLASFTPVFGLSSAAGTATGVNSFAIAELATVSTDSWEANDEPSLDHLDAFFADNPLLGAGLYVAG